ncbi:MAG: hypothetical protein MUF15_02175 [Acidobacteria bacterium]|jgi:hypothetical protein|nr:hypothetical protein [Acidobacteriota bacterium]
MEQEEKLVKNFQFCVTKLRNFFGVIPRSVEDHVNWDELNQHRELAEMSLNQMTSILAGDGDPIVRECFAYPKI